MRRPGAENLVRTAFGKRVAHRHVDAAERIDRRLHFGRRRFFRGRLAESQSGWIEPAVGRYREVAGTQEGPQEVKEFTRRWCIRDARLICSTAHRLKRDLAHAQPETRPRSRP